MTPRLQWTVAVFGMALILGGFAGGAWLVQRLVRDAEQPTFTDAPCSVRKP